MCTSSGNYNTYRTFKYYDLHKNLYFRVIIFNIVYLQILQLYQISLIHHGLMMVGPSGSGKSLAWRVLLKALERLEGVEGIAHVIDPKVRVLFYNEGEINE